jgi:pimeloyl-ACP methyl ester carboxylesterase
MKGLILLLLAVVFAKQATSQTKIDLQKLGQNSAVGKYANIRGFKMYYEVYGSGEPLLFIHGNGGSMKSFKQQVNFFAGKYKLILADSRAQGKSVDASDSLTYKIMADDFNELLNQLKIDSCNVIGWSDGGINALLLAMRHPKKVKKLVSTGANLWPDSTALDPYVFKDILKMYNGVSAEPVTAASANRKKILGLMLREPHISLKDLSKVRCPSLIIGGDHDAILPLHTLLIAQSIPKSYLWIVPNSGHATLVRYKDDFNKVTLDFLTKPFRKIQGNDMYR